MKTHDTELGAKRPIFGRRKIVPRVLVVDGKHHNRTFLVEILDEMGFISGECASSAELVAVLDTAPDLVVLGMSGDGVEIDKILRLLAENEFGGRVLSIGPRDSVLVAAVRQLGHELGIAMLPTLPTPFSTEALHECLAMFVPQGARPSPVVDVAEALKLGWLELWYQHKIDARSLVPCGAEALVRMRHPAWGIVAPAHFIPDSRDPSFRGFSEFVITRVLDDWHYFVEQQGRVGISINLPIAFLRDRSAVLDMCEKMPKHPAFGGLLLEIKCEEVLRHLDLVLEVAQQLRFRNIAISIDDVGGEWPALAGLDVFPFIELKVSRQFVSGCADDRLKQIVCRGIVDLAAGYGVRTVAKGIETRADFRTVHDIGFDQVQGFLFGKPLSARKFARAALMHPSRVAQG
jgi:EAL domain-containing protein (putative c-di-GMP-specific phosphodiesterase class I)/CheY-like chemotaxis protein